MPTKNSSKTLRFEALAETGKPGFWRYLVSIVFYSIVSWILALPIIIGSVLIQLDWSVVQASYRIQDKETVSRIFEQAVQVVSKDPFATPVIALFTVASVAISILALWLVIKVVHGRKLLTLITPRAKFDWKRMLTGFGVYTGVLVTLSLVSYGLSVVLGQPLGLRWNSQSWPSYLLFVLAIVPLLFVQVVFEEAFFRGYIFQAAYRASTWIQSKIKPKIAPLTLPSIIIAGAVTTLGFGLAHAANGPFEAGIYVALPYFATAIFLQYLAYRDQRLELSIGLHLANNIFAFLLVGNLLDGGRSSLLTDTTDAVGANTPLNLIFAVVPLVLFYLIVFVLLPKLTKPPKNV
jgi:uncharacterized protein